MEELAPWLWIVAIALIFWLLIIRPASKRQKAMTALQSSLAVGDEVMLTSGVFATVSSITDEHLEVEIAPGVSIRVVRGAIASVVQERDEVVETDRPADDSADHTADDSAANDTEER